MLPTAPLARKDLVSPETSQFVKINSGGSCCGPLWSGVSMICAVNFGSRVKHWHGASPATAMTHIAIAETLDGKVVEWVAHVSDEQYRR